jgi:hypothetical protein
MTSSSPPNMVAVYELRRDLRLIEMVQKATLHRDDAGLVPEHGLFGSDEWWAAIADGSLPTHTVRGRISSVFMSGHNDFPEFEVDDGSARTTWKREGDDSFYQVGRAVQIDYVLTRFKRSFTGNMYGPSVLRILISS